MKQFPWTECVIDATIATPSGAFCFCPIEGDITTADYKIVSGMNVISDKPPDGWRLRGVVHEDGQAAVEAFCEKNEEAIAILGGRGA